MNSQSCPASLRSARSYHWEWCTINNELRTTSGRRVLGGRPRHRWVLATAAILGVATAASPVDINGRRRCCGSQGRVPCGACIFPISVWSGTACLLKRLLVLPQRLCTARTRCRKNRRGVGHPSLGPTTPSGVARCLGERSNREHERAREGVARPDSLQVRDSYRYP